MNIQMFMYLNKGELAKIIANYFGVKKVTSFKVKEVQESSVDGVGFVCASYYQKKNVITVNRIAWNMLTNYEQFATIIHEMIHVYQHKYELCDFDYVKKYDERPQEIHADKHTKAILNMMGLEEVEESFFECDR